MLLADILTVLDELAPLRYAEHWDNVGLLVGNPHSQIDKVLVTVDYTAAVAEEAGSQGASLVVAYHPVLFSAIKRVPHDALWVDAVRRGVALYSPHTALDVAREGTNDVLADVCGIHSSARRPLRPHASMPGKTEPEGIGLGRIGAGLPITRAELALRIKTQLELSQVLVAGPMDAPARIVAVAAGAGGELLEPAMEAGADVFVTGELRHHDALLAASRGVTVIATLHSNSERKAVRAFASRLGERLPGVSVSPSAADQDPFVMM